MPFAQWHYPFENADNFDKELFPVLEKFQKRFNLLKPIIIADSGLLSKRNIQQLKAKNYEYN